MRVWHPLLPAALFTAACGLGLAGVAGNVGGDDGGPDSAFDVTILDRQVAEDVGSEASSDAGGSDAGFDGPGDAGDADAADVVLAPCMRDAGPTMVSVGDAGYCIDSTEVTMADYAVFLAAVDGGPPPNQPATCSWNTTNVPVSGWPYDAGFDPYPVVYVDWCDAYDYCAWAGKRLCGDLAGGSSPPDKFNDPAHSQWFRACSQDGALKYPYGNTYGGSVCNGKDNDAGHPVAVARYPGCVGGYPGIFDLSGNVWEWEDSCMGQQGRFDDCRTRGGGASDDMNGVSCGFDSAMHRDIADSDHGFRCCAP